jgi:hypothetical protein
MGGSAVQGTQVGELGDHLTPQLVRMGYTNVGIFAPQKRKAFVAHEPATPDIFRR